MRFRFCWDVDCPDWLLAEIATLSKLAVVAAVRWVLESAAGAVVAAAVLDSELQQLGLPKEHAAAITKVYGDHHQQLLQHLRHTSLKAGGDVNWSSRVMGLAVGGTQKPIVRLSLQNGPSTPTTLTVTPSQLHALIQELTEARQMMESIH
ncbi:COMM domain-containing protein 4-like [Homarus americanus]|uniref:COMM domain-containing protein 4-like n=1 Tax=Homarus americanus TaxID=6706 RepID=A0A8J5JSM2_HOMAM|nr:COMM domain-containing protein 4-like [Homarus americanus]